MEADEELLFEYFQYITRLKKCSVSRPVNDWTVRPVSKVAHFLSAAGAGYNRAMIISRTCQLGVVFALACGACSSNSARHDAAPATRDAPSLSLDAGAIGPLEVSWIHGSPSCADDSDPPLQTYQVDADTFILRQNKCVNFEAPFVYLLFGDERVFMLDTGATSSAQSFPIAETVRGIIDGWLSERGQSGVELVVAHSHGHGDHTAGDGQFAGQPDTALVAASVSAIQTFFGISDWPEQSVEYDLGGRVLDIVGIPGHESAHIAVYDRRTGILLTGDTLYPGRLYIRDFEQYRASIQRLVALVAERPVSHVLGTHIEMTTTAGVDYPIGTTYQPDELPLELSRTHLEELNAALQAMNAPVREVHDHFIIYPL